VSVNKWGVVSVVALLAVLPVAAVGWHVGGPHTRISDIPPFIPLIAAILCSTAAAIRGSQWWLTMTIVAALWGALALFQIIVPH
jgi:hypothetical protein